MDELTLGSVRIMAWGLFSAARISALSALDRFTEPICRRDEKGNIWVEETGITAFVISAEFFRAG